MIWAAMSLFGAVFLFWFGNYTAGKYRRLYGKLPEVRPDPPPVRYGATTKESYEPVDNYACVSMCSLITMSSCIPDFSTAVSPYVVRRR